MAKRLPKSGFTLIEVLVTVVLVVIISFLSLGMMGRMGSIQATQRQSYLLSTELQSVLDTVSRDIVSSNKGSGTLNGYNLNMAAVLTAGDTYSSYLSDANGLQLSLSAPDDVLAVNIPVRDVYGKPTGASETRVYCTEPQTDGVSSTILGKRLVRYIIPKEGVQITKNQLRCTPTGIRDGFSLSDIPTQKDYLTDPAVLIISLKFWPTWYKDRGSVDVYPFWGEGAAGVTTEIVARYYAQNVFSSKETARDNDLTSPTDSQIVARRTVGRNSLFLYSP